MSAPNNGWVWRFMINGMDPRERLTYTFASKEEYQEALDLANLICDSDSDYSVDDQGLITNHLDTLASFREGWAEEIAEIEHYEAACEIETANPLASGPCPFCGQTRSEDTTVDGTPERPKIECGGVGEGQCDGMNRYQDGR